MDRKPPKLNDDERATLATSLQYCREAMVRKVEGLDEDASRQVLVGSGTSLLWLMKHVTFAERVWIFGRFRGDASQVSSNEIEPGDSLAGAVEAYERTWAEVDGVVAAAALDDRCVDDQDDQPVNLRWILVHLIEETARHAGHADILREQLDGHTGR